MKRFGCLLLVFLNGYIPSFAQKHPLCSYSLAVTTLHTNLPLGSFASLFSKDFHPGIEAGARFNWKEKAKHNWYQEFLLAYSYQRWVQHTVSLYTATGYQYKFPLNFYADVSLGAGYLHAFPDSRIYKLQADGSYRKKLNTGRPQLLAELGIGIGKTFSSGRGVFLKYQQRFQTPFIKSYVPVLPANRMELGVLWPLHQKKKLKE